MSRAIFAALTAGLIMLPRPTIASTLSQGARLDPGTISNFCAAVELQSTEMHPLFPEQRYTYQTLLYVWSGVSAADIVEVRSRKVRDFMNANLPRLLCNQFNFNPRDGNILKLAVAKQSTSFIRDAAQVWRVNLNQIDAADGKTVLDYVRDRRRSAGTAYSNLLGRYYAMLRAAGALHTDELR